MTQHDITDNKLVADLWLLKDNPEADHVKAAGKAVASLVARNQWDAHTEATMIRLCEAVHFDPQAHDWHKLIPKFADGSITTTLDNNQQIGYTDH